MFGRGGAAILFLLACCVSSPGHPALDERCSASAFETDARATFDACSSVLDRGGLTDALRAEALKIRGRCLHRLARVDEAIRDYDAARLLAPKDPELYLRRGWTAYDKHEFELALSLATEALKLKPEYAAAYDLAGSVFGALGEWDKAKATFDEAIRLEPNEPRFRYSRYLIRPGRQFPAESLRELDDLLALPIAAITKPTALAYKGMRTSYRVAARLERVPQLTRLGRLEEAAKALDQAVLDDPGALTFASRAQFNLSHSAPEAVVQADLDRSLTDDSNVWYSRNVQGRVYFYGKRFEDAAKEFARAVELSPTEGILHWWLAQSLRKLGRFDEAADAALTAFRVDTDFMAQQIPMLQLRGYLPAELREDDSLVPALADAMRACMLDERCW